MKKIYLLLVLVSYKSFSQDYQNSTTYTRLNLTITAEKTVPEETAPDKVLLKKNGVYIKAYRNNIPSAVLSDFTKKYEGAENVTWKVDEKEVTSCFTFKDQKIICTYKQNGHLLTTRKTYDSTKLTRRIKHFIQDELGKGYHINNITEVINEGLTQYEISLVNQFKICVVRISENKDAEPLLDEKTFYTKAEADKI